MSVYTAVRVLAKRKNITIAKLERDLSFTNGLVSKWNKSVPSADRLQQVADYLGVTSAYILNKAKEEK